MKMYSYTTCNVHVYNCTFDWVHHILLQNVEEARVMETVFIWFTESLWFIKECVHVNISLSWFINIIIYGTLQGSVIVQVLSIN